MRERPFLLMERMNQNEIKMLPILIDTKEEVLECIEMIILYCIECQEENFVRYEYEKCSEL